jgi:pilus assembly protein Flp/PilA
MSDFLTSARINCSLAFETAVRHARRLRHDAGQTAAEYMGVLLVVSVIIAAVATTDIGDTIKGKMSDLVGMIAKGDKGTDAQGGGQANGRQQGNGNCGRDC